jgi:predicted DNA-binding protein (MmcQ/YjbR family)
MGLKPRRPPRSTGLAAIADRLREFALSLPGATEEFPWGESVAKVRGKVFVFLGRREPGSLGFSVKLPHSGGDVLAMPFATPTGYGLGKAGWVSMTFGPDDDLPAEMLEAWVLESYRAIAPKKLIAELDAAHRSR